VKIRTEMLARADLTPATKLVYAAILDRIGSNTDAWPSVARIAADCALERKKVFKCIKQLERVGLITVARKYGAANRYILSTSPKTGPVPKADQSQNGTSPKTGPVPKRDSESGSVNQIKGTRAKKAKASGPSLPFPPIPPLSLSPPVISKEEKDSAHSLGDRGGVGEKGAKTRPQNIKQAFDTKRLKSAAIQVYAGYPRKVGRAKALTAIAKALIMIQKRKNVPDTAEWLLDRVRAFAASPAGQAGQFTPHPTTWFNQGRYDDDEAEWSREDRPGSRGGAGGLPKSREIIPVRDFT